MVIIISVYGLECEINTWVSKLTLTVTMVLPKSALSSVTSRQPQLRYGKLHYSTLLHDSSPFSSNSGKAAKEYDYLFR